MERVGARGRHRASTPWYRPSDTYFWGGILLCVAFGMSAVGACEAWRYQDFWWAAFFAAMNLGSAALYFVMVTGWLFWINPSGN